MKQSGNKFPCNKKKKKSISIPASSLQIHKPLNKVEFKKSNHPTSTSRWAAHNRRYHRYKHTGPLCYISQPDNTIYKNPRALKIRALKNRATKTKCTDQRSEFSLRAEARYAFRNAKRNTTCLAFNLITAKTN